ncbi:leucine-rich repeat domain-containing protein [Bifidobacterium thermophilum]|uniref:leucine-rich repeat domain-containing protein n=1 Tax=Bifidobacterium thermophilum TaxID=33905 RepID=UPI0030A6D83A
MPDRSTIAQCFPDQALAQGIAKKLKGDAGKTGEVLTSKDAQRVSVLNLSDSQVASVQGLQVFTNLVGLYLSGTKVSDTSPLAGLTKLSRLDLSGTKVSDVSPLAGLTKLSRLYLSGTKVSDVSPLAKLTDLDDLDLSNTKVSDVSPLVKLVNLGSLNLDKTQVSDVSPLAKLANLESLYLSGTQVSNVSPLAGLTNLGFLDLSGTKVSDVSPLAKLNLSLLDLSGTGVLDLGMLHGLSLYGDNTYTSTYTGITSFAGVRPSAKLTVNGDGSVSMPAPRWLDGTVVAPSSTSPAGGTLDAKRGVVTWKKYDAGASYSYDFKKSFTLKTDGSAVEFSGRVARWRMVFRDVTKDTPHAEDIGWLADAGVSTGWLEPDGSYSFRGMDSVKRQDMAAFLRREAMRLGVGDASSWKPSDADWRRFRDVSRDTPHAEDVLWLAHAGVSTGYPDGTFGGMLPVYRQDMAAFLHRLDNLKK